METERAGRPAETELRGERECTVSYLETGL